MRAALAILLATVSLAGCLSPTAAPPVTGKSLDPGVLVCLDEAAHTGCNQEATVTPPTRQANELSIAVNPLDPRNMIATGKDYTPEEAGDCVWAGIYATKDGGQTWTDQNVPGSPWKHRIDPAAPTNEFTKFWCATDPVVAFGPDGTAYWTVMPYQCDPASGSKTGRGILPNGGLNDWFWTCSSMYVLVSHDGGITWPEWKEVAFGPRLEHDKQWIATAPNGNVLLCWDRADDAADSGAPSNEVSGGSAIWCSRSTDKGRSWSEGVAANPDYPCFDPAMDFSADNAAYLVCVGTQDVMVSTSKDGLAWGKPTKVGAYEQPPPGGSENRWPSLRGCHFRALTTPQIAVDRSNGPYQGRVYVIWFDHSTGEGNALVSSSSDGGLTWSGPVRPHDDDPVLKADQFYPALSVGPDGTVDASWYDRRDNPNGCLFDTYYSYSRDGGATWAKNLRVSETSSDEQYSHHQNGMIFIGDYRDMDSSTEGAHLVWVDTRHGMADVFTATIRR